MHGVLLRLLEVLRKVVSITCPKVLEVLVDGHNTV